MQFFKYLIFTFSFLFSTYSFADYYFAYGNSVSGPFFSTTSGFCNYYKPKDHILTEIVSTYNPGICRYKHTTTNSTRGENFYKSTGTPPKPPTDQPPSECWHPDYKLVTQHVSKPIKSSMCLKINGVMCKYSADPQTLKNTVVINGYIDNTFESVSKTPDPNCKEQLLNPPCDPKDPYGGCYTPGDDGCTRQFNGSIICPDEVEPPIEQGCNGADYCKRPPQGCGQGYVSGTFNGERICIKTKPSNGGGSDGGGSDGGGSDGGGSDGGGSDGGGSDGGGSPELPVTPDLSGVINAIKNVASKIDHYSKETIESIDTMSKKITGKLDTSNGHLDQIEANTLSTKNNTAETNDLLQQILDKTGTGGDGSGDPSTGEGVDLTETNGLLGEIRDGINDIKNVFSDEGKTELEQIGQPSNDPRYSNAELNAQSSLNNLANKLTFGSSACVSDFQIQLPIFGSVNIALSQWCSLLALIKILFQLVVLLTCLRMLDATVRTI